ncbi:MAG: CDP-diacylglycerol--glycerol-3-phosphate 3-phosphatidyltransferase [Dehalococcoidia bacterium]|nr:CDP-diacylglycerol--glycerol-3-phosphate 3-phosphatidyltransferase [Dehalococcoidia bacterium]
MAAEQAVGPLTRQGVSPNQLTVAGLLLNAGAGAIMARGWLPLGGVAVLGASAFDLFDGALARVAGQKTRFGAFFDSTLDRYSESLLFFGLLVWFARTGRWPGAILCYLSLLGSLMVSYARARAEGLGLDCEVGWFQRPERMVVLGGGLLLPSPGPMVSLTILAALSQVTVIQRMIHVYRLTAGR